MILENVYKVYKTRNKKTEALSNFSYEFKKGLFYVINGHSGSGKTTLIQLLGFLCDKSSGKYIFNNIDSDKLTLDEKCEIRNKEIGFVFQNFYLNNNLNALQNVELPMLINDKIQNNKMEDRAKKLLKELGLEDKYYSYPDEMSGGEQQRVAIARALANSPKYILADEPTGALDIDNETKILEIFREIVDKGVTVIMVTHSDEALKYADVILKLKNGKLSGVKDEK